MKIALVTTTINVPKVLSLYRALGPEVHFYIVGDRKTPDEKVVDFLFDIPNHAYYGADFLNDYKCAKFIGHDSIQRRNLGYLEALKGGADVIVTVDDDNVPVARDYFENFETVFAEGGVYDGPILTNSQGWVDPGRLLVPPAKHRGFPYDVRSEIEVGHVVGAKVGAAAGLVLGDPDVDSVTRMVLAPNIQSVSELARAGVVVDPNVHTVWNSQNSAFIRELAPAMFLWPGSRFDDIFASLVAQRIMRERDLHVHFGQPFVWQQRNAHDLIKDLRAEIEGMARIRELAGVLGATKLHGETVTEQCRHLFEDVQGKVPFDVNAGLAWLEDCEAVL
jgi:hypothetical protein